MPDKSNSRYGTDSPGSVDGEKRRGRRRNGETAGGQGCQMHELSPELNRFLLGLQESRAATGQTCFNSTYKLCTYMNVRAGQGLVNLSFCAYTFEIINNNSDLPRGGGC